VSELKKPAVDSSTEIAALGLAGQTHRLT
jgi:hypothetical protein